MARRVDRIGAKRPDAGTEADAPERAGRAEAPEPAAPEEGPSETAAPPEAAAPEDERAPGPTAVQADETPYGTGTSALEARLGASKNPIFDDVRAGERGALIRRGDRGEQVREVQRILNERLGLEPPLEEDGHFGPTTEKAIRELQAGNNVEVDGIVGPETMGILDRMQGIPPHPAAAEASERYGGRSSRGRRERPAGSHAPAESSSPAETPTREREASTETERAPAPTATTGTEPAGTGSLRGPHGAMPTRDLTDAQAIEELRALRDAGRIDFDPPDPRPGDRIRLRYPIGGVDFQYQDRDARPNPDRQSQPISPRMAVGTVRLAEWARSRGVTEIRHWGYGVNRPGDYHGGGNAFDIAGFRGRDPRTGEEFHHDIATDWGRRPRRGDGQYRLDPASTEGRFFQDSYDFLTSEFSDRRRGGPSRIGDESRVIGPDHPNRRLGEQHENHFHVEVAPTRAERRRRGGQDHDD